jgi:hypothetical protein
MRLYKLLLALTTTSLLASCGGSSDNDTPKTAESLNSPTEFFNINSIEDASIDFSTPITFNELVENELPNVLGGGNYSVKDYFYDNNDNLSTIVSQNEEGNIFEQNSYSYTFNNEQVSNREEIFQAFSLDSSVVFELIINETWIGGVPQSANILRLNGEFDARNFVFETNDANQVVRIFEVIDGVDVLLNESQFSSVNTDSASVGDRISTTHFDENMFEIEQVSYSYDHDDNITTVIGLDEVDFIFHNSETKQTIRMSFDLDEFLNDELTNITISIFNYATANSCGNYSEQETKAFSILTPTCITNLTYNN